MEYELPQIEAWLRNRIPQLPDHFAKWALSRIRFHWHRGPGRKRTSNHIRGHSFKNWKYAITALGYPKNATNQPATWPSLGEILQAYGITMETHKGHAVELSHGEVDSALNELIQELARRQKDDQVKRRVNLSRVYSWNTNGIKESMDANDPDDPRFHKVRNLIRQARSAPLCWQETGMDDELQEKFRQKWPWMGIHSTPPSSGAKGGGVAVLWSKYAFGEELRTWDLVPHLAVGVSLDTTDGETTIVSVYIPPKDHRKSLRLITDSLEKIPPHGNAWIAGDFNLNTAGVTFEQEVDYSFARYGFTQVSVGTPVVTNRAGDRETSIDRCWIRDPEIARGTKVVGLRAKFLLDLINEHALLEASVKTHGYADAEDYPLFKVRNLGKIHPNSEDGRRLSENLIHGIRGPTPGHVQTQLAAEVHRFSDMRSQEETTWHFLRRRARRNCPRIFCRKRELEGLWEEGNKVNANLTDVKDVIDNIDVSDGTVLPRAMVASWLDALDRASANAQLHQYVKQASSALRVQRAYHRLAELSPKFSGQLTRLKGEDGEWVGTISQLEKETRRTRAFWAEKPPPLSNDAQRLLKWLETQDLPAPESMSPEVDTFLNWILASNDSAHGYDGVPYAVLRLLPRMFAEILAWFTRELEDKGPEAVRMMPQLLVWISKATAGDTGDAWRPLNMPSTLLRAFPGEY